MTAGARGRPIRHVIRIDAPIDVVRTYFTDPKRVAEWWPARATIDPRVGGTVELEVDRPDGQTDRASGAFVEILPGRVVLTWGFERDADLPPGSSRIEISLEPQGKATIVRLEHHGVPESRRRAHDDGWAHFLDRLQLALR